MYCIYNCVGYIRYMTDYILVYQMYCIYNCLCNIRYMADYILFNQMYCKRTVLYLNCFCNIRYIADYILLYQMYCIYYRVSHKKRPIKFKVFSRKSMSQNTKKMIDQVL